MKRIILILILFFNLLPCIKQGQIKWIGAVEVMAQGGEGPGGSEDVSWVCSVSDIVNSSTECTFNVSCSCTIKGQSVTAKFQVSHSIIFGDQVTSSEGSFTTPPASYECSCTCDTSKKKSTPPVVTPPVVVPPTVVPPTGGGTTTTITIGGSSGGGTPTTCPSISIASSSIPTSATATDGSITVEVSGGSGSYDISINTGSPLTGNTFNNLGIGSYTVTVTDKNYNCQSSSASKELALPCTSIKTQETVNTESSTCPSDSSSSVYEVTRDCNGNETGRKKLSAKCKCPDDDNFQVTAAMLSQIDNSGTPTQRADAAKYINQFKDDPDFQLNTRLRLAHFLAQIMAETDGFFTMTEGYNYSAERIKEIFPDEFKNIDATSYAHCKCLFDKVYCCKNGNGDSASHDGSTYRGHGFIQLTWEEMYQKFTKFYQQKFSDYTVNFVTNPTLLVTNIKYSVLSALWEATYYKGGLNKYADDDDGKKYSRGINLGNPNSKRKANKETERLKALNLAKKALCLP